MDKTDLQFALREARKLSRLLSPLGNDRWSKPARRSKELTPLYAQRFVGPRTNNPSSAHCFWELTYIFSGRGRITGSDPISATPNMLLLIPPGLAHAESSNQSMDTLWVGLHGTLLTDWPRRTITKIEDATIAQPLERLWLLGRMERHQVGMELDSLARQAVAHLQPVEAADPTDWAGHVLQYMHQNLDRVLSVADLANEMSCSEGHLHRRFKSAFDQTPVQYLNRLRLERAIDLMQNTRLTIKQIALRTGFSDPLYFSRVFRQSFGQSPRHMRK